MNCRVVAGLGAVAVALIASVPGLSAQAAPTFDVVSIRRVDPGTAPRGSSFDQRPDGALAATNVSMSQLIGRAFPLLPIADMPEWAQRERYDIRATSSLSSVTPADRLAMLRSMLADRFKLAVRVEPREQSGFVLVLARGDGRLGPGLTPVSTQCPEDPAASNTSTPPGESQAPDFKAAPPPCTARIVGAPVRDKQGDGKGAAGDLFEGEVTMANLALMLRVPAAGMVVDKTGLKGTYRIAMNFNLRPGGRGAPLSPEAGTNVPSVFVAVEEQLGLKLESSRVPIETLVIERLERPSDN